MRVLRRRRWQVSTLLVFLLAGTFLVGTTQAHSDAYHNCTEKKDTTAWGVWGYIMWTNPDLDGGAWVYHRVALNQSSPWRSVEWGWRKSGAGFHGLLGWDDGNGPQEREVSVSVGTHRYHLQYDPNTGWYWYYVDGSVACGNCYINAGLSSGSMVTGGGECWTGVEDMGHTLLYDLRYLRRNDDGTFVFSPWDGHTNYVDHDPYYNTNSSDNAFYDDGVGHDGA